MMLKDYKRVVEIDSTISDLHARLAALYNERSRIVIDTPATPANPQAETPVAEQADGNSLDNEWEVGQYNGLKEAWAEFGVKVPVYKSIQAKLSAAKTVIAELEDQLTDNNFDLLLVPPAAIIKKLIDSDACQELIMSHETRQTMLNEPAKRTWSVHVVALKPLPVTSGSMVLWADNERQIGGYQMPGLSAQEYIAYLFTGNYDWLVDENSWSILPRTLDPKNKSVVCVSYIGGNYRFETDTVEVLIGNNHFRPALEIK